MYALSTRQYLTLTFVLYATATGKPVDQLLDRANNSSGHNHFGELVPITELNTHDERLDDATEKSDYWEWFENDVEKDNVEQNTSHWESFEEKQRPHEKSLQGRIESSTRNVYEDESLQAQKRSEVPWSNVLNDNNLPIVKKSDPSIEEQSHVSDVLSNDNIYNESTLVLSDDDDQKITPGQKKDNDTASQAIHPTHVTTSDHRQTTSYALNNRPLPNRQDWEAHNAMPESRHEVDLVTPNDGIRDHDLVSNEHNLDEVINDGSRSDIFQDHDERRHLDDTRTSVRSNTFLGNATSPAVPPSIHDQVTTRTTSPAVPPSIHDQVTTSQAVPPSIHDQVSTRTTSQAFPPSIHDQVTTRTTSQAVPPSIHDQVTTRTTSEARMFIPLIESRLEAENEDVSEPRHSSTSPPPSDALVRSTSIDFSYNKTSPVEESSPDFSAMLATVTNRTSTALFIETTLPVFDEATTQETLIEATRETTTLEIKKEHLDMNKTEVDFSPFSNFSNDNFANISEVMMSTSSVKRPTDVAVTTILTSLPSTTSSHLDTTTQPTFEEQGSLNPSTTEKLLKPISPTAEDLTTHAEISFEDISEEKILDTYPTTASWATTSVSPATRLTVTTTYTTSRVLLTETSSTQPLTDLFTPDSFQKFSSSSSKTTAFSDFSSNTPSQATSTTASTTTVTSQLPTTMTSTESHTAESTTVQSGNCTSGLDLNGQDQTSRELPSTYLILELDITSTFFCSNKDKMKKEINRIMSNDTVSIHIDQIQLFEITSDSHHLQVNLYLLNKTMLYDHELTILCARILQNAIGSNYNFVILNRLKTVVIKDDSNEPLTSASQDSNLLNDPGVTVAIVLAVVGVCCCAGLIALQIFVRRRHKDQFGMKPNLRRSVSWSSDSIRLSSINKSRPNSGLFNPGLDISDSLEPSRPLNYTQLSNYCCNEKKIEEEFSMLPCSMPRLSVVPNGDEDKNRYANILPYAHTRVELLQESGHGGTYINANYVTGPNNQCQYYIATQAPIEKTLTDFWTMVWQQNSKAIVMLTQLEEDGQTKCVLYWPELVGQSAAIKIGDFLIELKQKDVHQEYIISKLEVQHLRKIEKREVYHFWYTCWPSHGLPEPISLVKLVLDTRPKYEGGSGPLIVHCSPGTGRTGTFIALDLCMHQFEALRMVDLLKTVYTIRQERAGAVQSKEQYTLLYNAISEYATVVVSPVVSAASSATTLHALLSS
ncbi:mucin-22 [Biomphalaria pfeifferi]|uniref:Mucin-22 n=1 Tax=Biomphalaria pfeifferi TaxID=112525 RepID=A0AAD8FAN0_BIOPF|nr:mucin-22 [Biomphalaria pfeifferi]